jgi:hypothetical protein
MQLEGTTTRIDRSGLGLCHPGDRISCFRQLIPHKFISGGNTGIAHFHLQAILLDSRINEHIFQDKQIDL